MARNSARQRHVPRLASRTHEAVAALPVLVAHAAETQIGDARAAQLAEAREGGAVGARVQDRIDPVARALQRSAQVRRAEKENVAYAPRPRMARFGAVAARAARDQAA